MKNKRFFVKIVGIVIGSISLVLGETISFISPMPWTTLRKDTITVKAQIDTSVAKKKKLELTLVTVKKGKTSKLVSKTFDVKDVSMDFPFGSIKKNLIGGEEYLQIQWSLPGTKEKGTIEPIGIADLSTIKSDTVSAIRFSEDIKIEDVPSKIGEKSYQTGKVSYSIGWNKEALFIAVNKTKEADTIKFTIDGKTGKNAFLSYPDRIIVCKLSDTVSVKGINYKRETNNNILTYSLQTWNNEMSYKEMGEKIIIRLPWYDTGIIPFEERTIGFGIFVTDAKGKNVGSLPAKADFYTPATWGILYLQK
ncbi:MAG: hypothetical protein N2053_07325 [Chitinispirillaceae bacterium]|nr:hypothetical protein [Chitinispirillaceae bacterium]